MPLRHLLALSAFVLLGVPPAPGAIYGTDDIRDIIHVPSYRHLSQSVAISVPNAFIERNPNGSFKITDVTIAGKVLCPGERFRSQPSLPAIGNCTGFLVGDRYLVTAGHCILPAGIVDDEVHPYCEGFSWYFDFHQDDSGLANTERVPANRLYRCKRVIRAENKDELFDEANSKYPGADFAVIELDRPVDPELTPLKIARRPVKVGDEIFTIGHPLSLPAKFSGISRVVKNDPKRDYYEAYLDTFSGNSGGPVFNSRNEVVGILVGGHPIDFIWDRDAECVRLNRCDQSGRSCSENSPFPNLPVTNQIQRVEAVLKYIP